MESIRKQFSLDWLPGSQAGAARETSELTRSSLDEARDFIYGSGIGNALLKAPEQQMQLHDLARALKDAQEQNEIKKIPLLASCDSRVLILGLAYKPNVDDERESPSYVLMDLLSQRGAELEYYDPYVPMIKPTREHSHWAGKKSIEWGRATIESFDLVLIATNHSCVDYQDLADWARCIVDTRNAMASVPVAPGKVWKA